MAAKLKLKGDTLIVTLSNSTLFSLFRDIKKYIEASDLPEERYWTVVIDLQPDFIGYYCAKLYQRNGA